MYIKDVVKVQLVSDFRGTLVYPSFVYTLHDGCLDAGTGIFNGGL